MKDQDIHAELSSIRDLMERSAKFISLSGLSGVMAGIYALIGAFLGWEILTHESVGLLRNDFAVIIQLCIVAFGVLVLSIGTGVWLSIRKAKKLGQPFWNTGSQRLLINMAIPLVSGGLFTFILIYRGYYGVVAPATLIFYGMALVAGSHYTYSGVKSLGIIEILLGLLCALMPGYGLRCWAIGFGLLHIIYGTVMHFKYDK
ncbi:hypothetical protein [Mucilaginibacter ginsenosidivorax]|uniref:Uncharacterized protein n=1 Tax=Mucilaginibacter ginsenosidivorax TaxID=862126 RepID=A0A5B8VYX5_9SPHI|nr:hypothetical protein [Mucilaginibacter ginsenosidivorax]QEC76501.1 hypothetical protein FSB76_11290 [Mucilaginibacter ginsenosidivorax]